ncbi:MAG: bifunctional (p)ppGpp synthetase/guanosine-3',5'-bis(diphosphate) 3'-pyrophosphohydrolase [Oscillospiraceae bacterium]|jgi:GTP pyrophosphokinase|nr:bifunctional (p)ppGpp synthetase/guanosine-3',5'-bis(diphosphate) 3'-pyrophosphohydrolase [Oscillospiraceae bacterium]
MDTSAVLAREYAALEDACLAYMPHADKALLRRAFDFAAAAHEGQNRRSGEPYAVHPSAVALIITEMNMDMESVIAALLHDVIEDTKYTYAYVKAQFGAAVADMVDGVTKISRIRYTYTEDRQMENLRKLFIAMARDLRVMIVKIADRLHNMRTIDYLPEQRRREIALETMEIYAPIAHRLGMQRFKWELEDRSLRCLDPVGTAEIEQELEERRLDHSFFMESVKEVLEKRLREAGVKYLSIEGRIKHIYSIYRKLMGQHKAMFEIYDLYAVRIIVADSPHHSECYNALGVVHDIYKAMPGRLKDYISTPKPNMYQSLHTTVMGKLGQPFEVQIRSESMHRTAEMGISAHWKYKEGSTDNSADEMFAWVRRLLESQQDTDAEDFIRSIKVEMFADEVFVFTPKSKVVNLPYGANPIDFAYAIHSAVGNRMTGAKVNGRMVTIDYVLQNGDIVEIITAGGSHGPSRDWLKLVKTSEARNKIKQWFKKEKREENVAAGKAEFERELKRSGISPSTILNEDITPPALRRMSFATPDELYAAIGYGGISALRAINRFRDELIRQNRQHITDKAALEKVHAAVRKPPKATSGVVVEDIGNCLIRFARCCAPVPGDDIVGYVTKGCGVSLHRADCKNIGNARAAADGKYVSARWAEQIERNYPTGLQIRARDRDGLVAELLEVFNAQKTKPSYITAKALPNGSAVVNVTVSVANSAELDRLRNKLTQVHGVAEVVRREAS